MQTITITRKSAIIETTNTVGGCLEQGGVLGRRVAYPIADACRVTGLSAAELAAADPSACLLGEAVTLAERLAHEVPGRVLTRGTGIR